MAVDVNELVAALATEPEDGPAHRALLERGAEAVPALCGALEDGAAGVRLGAARLLGRLGDRAAVPALCRALRDDESPVRWTAAWALGELRDRDALPELCDALDDSDPGVRRRAAEAVRGFGAAAVPVLRGILVSSQPDRWPRAAEALAEIGEPAVESLCLLLQQGPSFSRQWAAEALAGIAGKHGCIGTRQALPTLRKLRGRQGWFSGGVDITRATYETAIRRIEEGTAANHDLPLPGAPTAHASEDLPRPGSASGE
jgi:HEAT repeat protein